MDHARPGNHQTGTRSTREIPHGRRRVTGRLLVAHAQVGDALALGGTGDGKDREAHHTKHELDALLFQAPGNQSGTVDIGHDKAPCLKSIPGKAKKASPPCFYTN